MPMFQVDSAQVQKFQDAIGKALFAAEATSPEVKAALAPVHAALLAGEGYTVAQSNGSVRPQEGGQPKS